MKQLLILCFSLCLMASPTKALSQTEGSLAPGTDAQASHDEPATPQTPPPTFVLETLPDDSPAMAKKKAALRLLQAYDLTVRQLTVCMATDPAAAQARNGFNGRNGSTLGQIMQVIKQLGGLSQDVRNVLDREQNAKMEQGVDNCAALIKHVNSGSQDIYKGKDYVDDYKLVRSK